MTAADPRGLLALLSKDDLLRVVAALALDAGDEAEIARLATLAPARVTKALATLAAAGLAERGGAGWRLRRERFAETLARATAKPASDLPRSIQPFFRDGRLQEVPVHRAKRLEVLELVARRFEAGREYAEAEVNALLGEVHADSASLRRYLVDEGFLARSGGVYRRAERGARD